MKRVHHPLLVGAALVLLTCLTQRAEAKPVQSNIIVDAKTGSVITESNADAVTQPASLTKMMTLYLLFERLEQGKLKLSDNITFSSYAASRAATNLNVQAGDKIGVETAILAVVVRSANDVATAIAETIGGTEESFARQMTVKARQLGMNSTNFHNASGLPDAEQRTTARDMAVLGVALMRDFPQYYPYFSRYTFAYHGVNYTGHNRLLKSFKGADGIKTGYVRASGFNLVTSAERDGRRLVGVVLGGDSVPTRDKKMASLMQTAFNTHGGTGDMLIAKLQGGTNRSGTNKSMSDAVAAALSEPTTAMSNTPETAEAETIATPMLASASATTAADTVSTSTTALTTGGSADELKPILKPGTQLALASASETKVASAKRKKQLTVDDQTTANVWKSSTGNYGIQIGAYSQFKSAQRAAGKATKSLPNLLADARVVIDQQKSSSNTLYRARVFGLTRNDAESACRKLRDCMVLKSDSNLAMDSN
ncbi:D-alanyl-D-alanine carboxypeptidase [Dongia soli]|uniref:D-alanyl-D-alanine carboxypeptidase n=1 Tax=Dongia soli TaxID=600628 RepID=A0ABU5EBL4_9PROT|nr:D-alanyl-D-alanine carboxypeptidase [Dongia soli]MDY0883741.1 D-alanyl-D-alanine carboxypeptidase [Dongia soli]